MLGYLAYVNTRGSLCMAIAIKRDTNTYSSEQVTGAHTTPFILRFPVSAMYWSALSFIHVHIATVGNILATALVVLRKIYSHTLVINGLQR